MVDTEVTFDTGGVANIVTGWHLPNAAHALTVERFRMYCADGMVDMELDKPGMCELNTPDGRTERHVLFRTFRADGTVGGHARAVERERQALVEDMRTVRRQLGCDQGRALQLS